MFRITPGKYLVQTKKKPAYWLVVLKDNTFKIEPLKRASS
jgi:hypothetical protein